MTKTDLIQAHQRTEKEKEHRSTPVIEHPFRTLCPLYLENGQENTTVIPDTVIENVVQTASDMIYQYIHMHNIDNQMQDYIIAKVPSARQVIYRAMLYQVMYVCNVGNLYLSKEKADRDAAIDVLAIQILNTTLPEVGRSVLYTGSWMRGAWCK